MVRGKCGSSRPDIFRREAMTVVAGVDRQCPFVHDAGNVPEWSQSDAGI